MAAASGCRAAEQGWQGQPIDTAHLRLRRLVAEDIDVLTGLLDDRELVRHTATLPFPYRRQDAERFVAQVAADRIDGRALVFAIEDRVTRELLGTIGATLDGNNAEIGYWLGRAHWGQGFASEALRRCLRMLFINFQIDKVWAAVLPDNDRSRRMLDRHGFGFVERRARDAAGQGHAIEMDVFALTSADWQSRWQARPLLMVAAAALIDTDGRVLLARRPAGKAMAGQWEFPGGKLNQGETPEAALIRELKEELDIDVGQACLAPLAFASHDYDRFHLLMPLFACRQWDGIMSAREGQTLAWVAPARLSDYPLPPADVPLVAMLRDWL